MATVWRVGQGLWIVMIHCIHFLHMSSSVVCVVSSGVFVFQCHGLLDVAQCAGDSTRAYACWTFPEKPFSFVRPVALTLRR